MDLHCKLTSQQKTIKRKQNSIKHKNSRAGLVSFFFHIIINHHLFLISLLGAWKEFCNLIFAAIKKGFHKSYAEFHMLCHSIKFIQSTIFIFINRLYSTFESLFVWHIVPSKFNVRYFKRQMQMWQFTRYYMTAYLFCSIL